MSDNLKKLAIVNGLSNIARELKHVSDLITSIEGDASEQLKAAVDAFGFFKAIAAEVDAEMEPFKKVLAAKGQGAYEGDLYRSTVSEFDQERLDLEAVRAKLSVQFLRAHTLTTHVTKVQSKARNNINVLN